MSSAQSAADYDELRQNDHQLPEVNSADRKPFNQVPVASISGVKSPHDNFGGDSSTETDIWPFCLFVDLAVKWLFWPILGRFFGGLTP